jgi:hypothetical protein
MDEFPEQPKVPEQVWEALRLLQQLQEALTGSGAIVKGSLVLHIPLLNQKKGEPDENR